jgi:hypothetical protein
VRDEVNADDGWAKVRGAGIGGFQSSVTTVMARVFSLEQLQPWLDLSDRVAQLTPQASLIVERYFGREI